MGAMMQPGDLLDNKYAVERVIGRGGAGYVVAAQHVRLSRRVALKFLRPELATQPDLCRRFLREARAAAQLTGNHVVRILDADTLSTGQPYLVMEYLEGEDIAALLRRRGQLPVAEAVGYILQACQAVSEAHALRIVHRDIKPANLFLTTGPAASVVKVLDFGLSKVLDVGGIADDVTDSNHVMGSPHFMSPEQIRTPRDVDERTDIWSIGATLFTLLTGRVPFEGQSLMEVCAALLCGPPPRIDPARAAVPTELEAVVLRCLQVDAAARPASVALLARELAGFACPRAAGAVVEVDVAASPEPPRAPSLSTAPVEASPAISSHRGRAGAIVPRATRVAVVCAAIGLLAFAARMNVDSRDRSPGPASPSVLAALHGVPPPVSVERAPDDVAELGAADSDRAPEARVEAGEAKEVVREDAARSVPVAPRSVQASSPPLPKGAASATALPSLRPTTCDHPFYIDPRGIKAIRAECL